MELPEFPRRDGCLRAPPAGRRGRSGRRPGRAGGGDRKRQRRQGRFQAADQQGRRADRLRRWSGTHRPKHIKAPDSEQGDGPFMTIDGRTVDLRDVPNPGRKVALTFDDGPAPLTPKFLDKLARLKVPATFFVIGLHVGEYPQLVKRESDMGMTVANHTYDHSDMTTLGPADQRAQIVRTSGLDRGGDRAQAVLLPLPRTGLELLRRAPDGAAGHGRRDLLDRHAGLAAGRQARRDSKRARRQAGRGDPDARRRPEPRADARGARPDRQGPAQARLQAGDARRALPAGGRAGAAPEPTACHRLGLSAG